jgi:hypothetical protein
MLFSLFEDLYLSVVLSAFFVLYVNLVINSLVTRTNEGSEIIYLPLNDQSLYTSEIITSLFPKFFSKWNEKTDQVNRMRIKDKYRSPLGNSLPWQVFQLVRTLHLLLETCSNCVLGYYIFTVLAWIILISSVIITNVL